MSIRLPVLSSNQVRLAEAFGRSLFRLRSGGAPAPFSASFAVTDRCNLHCSYCNCPALDRTQLSLNDIVGLFEQLRSIGVVRLGLMGGEPMARPDLPEIIALARRIGFIVCVNSNLTLYDDYSERLEGVDLIFTSLDGPKKIHELNRGSESYDGVIDAIRQLIDKKVAIVAICVVTAANLDSIDSLLETADEEGFEIHFQPQCAGGEVTQGGYPADLSNERLRQSFVYLLEQKVAGRPIASSKNYLEYVSNWNDFRNIYRMNANKECAAGRGFLYVDPRGNAYPCIGCRGRTTPVNLLTQSWKTDWDRSTPCTECIVGPMLEFNLLFEHPISQLFEIWQSYRLN